MVIVHRLRSSGEIRQTVARRCAAGGGTVVVHVNRREDELPARVAVVAGRRVGNAVARNRAKRRLREVIRATAIPTGVDLVVTAKAGADTVAFDALAADLRSSVRRALRRAAEQAVPA